MLEWKHFSDHEIEYNSQRPYIYLRVVRSLLQNLRRHISRSSTAVNDLVAWCNNLRETEVCYFDTLQLLRVFLAWDWILHFDKDVLRFDVSVHDSTRVEVAKSFKCLLHDLSDLHFRQVILIQIVIQLAAFDRLH